MTARSSAGPRFTTRHAILCMVAISSALLFFNTIYLTSPPSEPLNRHSATTEGNSIRDPVYPYPHPHAPSHNDDGSSLPPPPPSHSDFDPHPPPPPPEDDTYLSEGFDQESEEQREEQQQQRGPGNNKNSATNTKNDQLNDEHNTNEINNNNSNNNYNTNHNTDTTTSIADDDNNDNGNDSSATQEQQEGDDDEDITDPFDLEDGDQHIEEPHPTSEVLPGEFDDGDDEIQEEGDEDTSNSGDLFGTEPTTTTTSSSTPSRKPQPQQEEKDTVPNQCPSLYLTTTESTANSENSPDYRSSSTTLPSNEEYDITDYDCQAIAPNPVTVPAAKAIVDRFQVFVCKSKVDCSQGFVQIERTLQAPLVSPKVSTNKVDNNYFHNVGGPDDFYILLEGPQRLALSARINQSKGSRSIREVLDFNNNLLAGNNKNNNNEEQEDEDASSPSSVDDLNNNDSTTTSPSQQLLIYRADYRLVLPGTYTLSTRLTYEHYLAVRENRPGVWPQWTHTDLVVPQTPILGDICPSCDLETFLETVHQDRQSSAFKACDRMAPVRGSYWQEKYANQVFTEIDTFNHGEGIFVDRERTFPQTQAIPGEKTTFQGYRFVPNGCTLTVTDSLNHPGSQAPYTDHCDSVTSMATEMVNSTKPGTDFPIRKVLYTGDSQVRSIYVATLQHFRALPYAKSRFAEHEEYLVGTSIMLRYKADQFLVDLIDSTDEYLDQFDTILFNLGQWPASGSVAGGHWTTEMLVERWKHVQERLQRWKDNGKPEGTAKRVIWAGMNAFPMRTDKHIRTKGDWRTNGRLGHWDDLIERELQKPGAWFRRLNSWQYTFPVVDQVTDKAHYQQTDAIDAFLQEALFKVDLCSKVVADVPNVMVDNLENY